MTLGIPRLRELFMTATKSIKTPVMTLPLLPGKTKKDAEGLANHLRRIRLAEVPPVHPPLVTYAPCVDFSGIALMMTKVFIPWRLPS